MMLALVLLAALPGCPKLKAGVWIPGACVEPPARIRQGLDSYAKAELYCLKNPKGVAYWLDHTYTHTTVNRACPAFLKTYKPAKK